MKVVRIIARLNVGGPARHVTWLTALMRRAGIASVLVAGTVPEGEGDMTYFAEAHAVEPVIIPEMSREISVKDGLTIWKLYRLLLRERPDIVHTHTAKAGTVGRVAGLLYRWLTPRTFIFRPRPIRFVHTYHGHIFHSYYGKLKTRLFLLIEQILARIATDRIVVISPQQYREIHEEFRVGRSGQFSVIPLGLDLGAFSDWRTRRNSLRAELGAEDEEILVGIVGRLTEIKNHKLFLDAAALYKKERARVTREEPGGVIARRVRFIIIGDGQLLSSLKEQAKELGLDRDVVFLGQRDDPENFYAALDVVALTSLNEGTPLTLIEALACARAVVAVGVGGVIDLLGTPVDPGTVPAAAAYTVCEHGLRVRPRDACAFSRALARLIGDDVLREEMGRRGRRFVEENYSLERLVTDVTNLYQELIRPDEASPRDLSQPEALHSRRRV